MDVRELGQLSQNQEFHHWWIRTRFVHLEAALARAAAESPRGLSVLEMGSGTGQNLRYLRQESPLAHRIVGLVGVEPQFDASRIPTPWLRPDDQILKAPPETGWEGRFDLLVAMDVLEHLEMDGKALEEWSRWVRPGGLVFITVPAFSGLWSRHDEKLGHYRRYTRSALETLARTAGLRTERTRYLFSHAFPAVFVLRKLARRLGRPRRAGTAVSTDLRPAPRLLNLALTGLGRLEAWLGGNPWVGTSVMGVFQKPGGSSHA